MREIKVDGVSILAEYLGKGRHCIGAYRGVEGGRYRDPSKVVYLFVEEDDNSRYPLTDGACGVYQGVDAPIKHLPKLTKHEQIQRRGGKWFNVYSMPYSPRITAQHEDWKVLKQLERDRMIAFIKHDTPQWVYAGDLNYETIELARKLDMKQSILDALKELADSACNFGALMFEFGARNIGVGDDGEVVFRDCLFDSERLYKQNMGARGYR